MSVLEPGLLLSGCRGGCLLSRFFFGIPSLLYNGGKTLDFLAHGPILFQIKQVAWIPTIKGLICSSDYEGLSY